ncbi:Polynucleotide 5'-hydroxyl-kinase NOL9 [Bienertia sinuspersici]
MIILAHILVIHHLSQESPPLPQQLLLPAKQGLTHHQVTLFLLHLRIYQTTLQVVVVVVLLICHHLLILYFLTFLTIIGMEHKHRLINHHHLCRPLHLPDQRF